MTFHVIAAEAGHTLAKILRSRLHETKPSWTAVRTLIEGRRVKLGGGICVDPTRRLKEGDRVELLKSPAKLAPGATPGEIVIRFLDEHVVVVEKPSGVSSVRHPAEMLWTEEQRKLDPTLQDLTQWAVAKKLGTSKLPPLRIVHRLDRETSGLLVFTRSVIAEKNLGQQFRKHSVTRRYLAIVPGVMIAKTITSTLIRDRGDGRRGSTKQPDATGKVAITHIEIEERLPKSTVLRCRLETGRTHQIRIHLAEAGHPVAGERVYTKDRGGVDLPKLEKAPRLALHALELGFAHPVTNEEMHWTMPLPKDLAKFVDHLRS